MTRNYILFRERKLRRRRRNNRRAVVVVVVVVVQIKYTTDNFLGYKWVICLIQSSTVSLYTDFYQMFYKLHYFDNAYSVLIRQYATWLTYHLYVLTIETSFYKLFILFINITCFWRDLHLSKIADHYWVLMYTTIITVYSIT